MPSYWKITPKVVQILIIGLVGILLVGLWRLPNRAADGPNVAGLPTADNEPEPQVTTEELWSVLEDSSSDAVSRNRSATALAKLGPEILSRLKKNLTSKEPSRRRLAVRVLLASPPLGKTLQSEVLTLIKDPDEAIAAEAIAVAGRIGASNAQTVDALFQSLSSPSKSIAEAGATALALAHRPNDVLRVLDVMDTASELPRSVLVRGLCTTAKSNPASVRQALVERLARGDEIPLTRIYSYPGNPFSQVMRALPLDEQVAVARQARQHPDVLTRGQAAVVVLNSQPELLKEFQDDVREAIRWALKTNVPRGEWSLYATAQPERVMNPILIPLLSSEIPSVRRHAALMIRSKRGMASLVAPLIKGLAAAEGADRLPFIYALSEVGPAAASAIPLLEKLADSGSAEWKDDCQRALVRIQAPAEPVPTR